MKPGEHGMLTIGDKTYPCTVESVDVENHLGHYAEGGWLHPVPLGSSFRVTVELDEDARKLLEDVIATLGIQVVTKP